MDELVNALLTRRIRPSFHRIKILEYLIHHRIHPTAAQIFRQLQREIPTMSKATVYNTLNVFLSTGLVRSLTIDDTETRYDITTTNHGHFKCSACGAIHDFDVNTNGCNIDGLEGFAVERKDIYFRGLCPKCA